MTKFLSFDDFVLNEANNTYEVSSFLKDMKKLGFVEYKTKNGIGFKKEIIDKEGKKHTLTQSTHFHNNGGGRYVNQYALRDVIARIVQEYRLTGDMSSLDKIPWSAWGEKRPTQKELDNPTNFIEKDNTEEEEARKESEERDIYNARVRFNKVELVPIENKWYGFDKGLQLMIMTKKNAKGQLIKRYNVCRSETDRRPLNKDWYDDVWENPNNPKLPLGVGLAKENKLKRKEHIYDINPLRKDGTVDLSITIEEEINYENLLDLNINE